MKPVGVSTCFSQGHTYASVCFGASAAHVDLGVGNRLCCIQLLCVVSEQLPKSSGELMFKLSYLKQNCLLGGLIRQLKDLETGSI